MHKKEIRWDHVHTPVALQKRLNAWALKNKTMILKPLVHALLYSSYV